MNYHRPEDAEKAINTLNGLRLQNKTIKVSLEDVRVAQKAPRCVAAINQDANTSDADRDPSSVQEFRGIFIRDSGAVRNLNQIY